MYCFGLQIHSMHNGFLSKIGKEAGKNTQIFGLAMGEGGNFFIWARWRSHLGALRAHSLILRGGADATQNNIPPFCPLFHYGTVAILFSFDFNTDFQ